MRRGLTVVLLALVCSGCAGAYRPITMPTTGLHEARIAVATLGAAIEVVRPILPDTSMCRQILAALESIHATGVSMVTAWGRLGHEPVGWPLYVVEALAVLEDLHDELKDHGVPIPSAVGIAIGAAQLVWPVLFGVG